MQGRLVLALPREDLVRCLRALGDPLRLRIVVLLGQPPGLRSGPFAEREPGMCASDLCERMGRGHALVSHHVQVLRRAGLVLRIRRGRWSILTLDPARVAALGEQISLLGEAAVPVLGPPSSHSLASVAPGPRGGSVQTDVADARSR